MAMHDLSVGQVIDGFRLEARLDPGGMAAFWRVTRASESLPGMPMLMKVPLLRRGEDPITIIGFEVEQMILARLAGPHVPRSVAAGDFERPYIVMEFVAGRGLKTLLPNTLLPPDQVAATGAATARAVHDVHLQHVTHLDLKPSNVIIRPDGEAVLIDFGLSRHDQLPDLIAEEFEGAVGTGSYIAPGQVLGYRGVGVISISSLPANGHSESHSASRNGAAGCGAIHSHHAGGTMMFRPGCRKSSCVASKSTPPNATRAQRSLPSKLQHTSEVVLTRRAERRQRDSIGFVVTRWFRSRDARPRRRTSVAGQFARAQIVMAAVDLAPEARWLANAIAAEVRRMLATEPAARVTCINVLCTARLALDRLEDAQGGNLHLQRLIEPKHWARTLGITSDRITGHVLEAVEVATAVLDYARNSQVDHIVIGARGSSSLRRYLGSLSSRVVAEAPCTVTVVHLPQRGKDCLAEQLGSAPGSIR
jgi:serine/threonine protein kinase